MNENMSLAHAILTVEKNIKPNYPNAKIAEVVELKDDFGEYWGFVIDWYGNDGKYLDAPLCTVYKEDTSGYWERDYRNCDWSTEKEVKEPDCGWNDSDAVFYKAIKGLLIKPQTATCSIPILAGRNKKMERAKKLYDEAVAGKRFRFHFKDGHISEGYIIGWDIAFDDNENPVFDISKDGQKIDEITFLSELESYEIIG